YAGHDLRRGECRRGVDRDPGVAQAGPGLRWRCRTARVLRVRTAVHVDDRDRQARDGRMEVARTAVRLHARPGLPRRARSERDLLIHPQPRSPTTSAIILRTWAISSSFTVCPIPG